VADVLVHYHMLDFKARCAVALTTGIVKEAKRRHDLDPLTTIAVGRAISCAALLASTLKAGKEYVHCSFAGEGVLARVIGECNGDGDCRGYTLPARIVDVIEPGGRVPESVGEAMGHRGVLTVTRGVATERLPYTAVSALENGEIATDVARYLTDSEQVPSAVAAGVKLAPDGEVVAAGGVLVQKLGGVELDEAVLVELENRMRLELHLSDRIAAGETADEIVAFLQGGAGGSLGGNAGFGQLLARPLQFRCACSRERMAHALATLGEEELRQIRRETGKIETRCQYCSELRQFRLEELLTH
jgi:molecular chaperone Hsp33